MIRTRLLATLLASLVFACGGAQSRTPADEGGNSPEERERNRAALDELMEKARREKRDAPATTEAPATQSVEVTTAVVAPAEEGLTRGNVDAYLSKGPHALLGAVELEPARRGDEVIGFELRNIAPPAGFLLDAGFRTGDVIRSVNGHSIVHPDGFLKAWHDVGRNDRIAVDYVRDGVAGRMEFTIR